MNDDQRANYGPAIEKSGFAKLPFMAGTPPESNDRDKNIWILIARYSQLALALPASVVTGLAIGWALDRWLKTRWITVVGLLFGAVAGFSELIRNIVKSSRKS